jgi:hypothetical protein
MKEEGIYMVTEFIEDCLVEFINCGDGVVENCRAAGYPYLVEKDVQKWEMYLCNPFIRGVECVVKEGVYSEVVYFQECVIDEYHCVVEEFLANWAVKEEVMFRF